MTERKLEKICPLSLASRDIEPCMQDRCALWDNRKKQCGLLSIVQELEYICYILESPHYVAKDINMTANNHEKIKFV